ncbi:polynucleotide 5'-hydroxyl-kinase [Aureococcus anophagefferens]|nr:polynucleotide 5'-hydroxyl-kinase [Aureococcus anophagefferens]
MVPSRLDLNQFQDLSSTLKRVAAVRGAGVGARDGVPPSRWDQPRPKTPPPKKRPPPLAARAPLAAGDAEVLTVHAGITVELRDVAAANPAMVPAVEAADERLRRLPESALVFTNGRGEPDLRKNVEWQRLVAEEDALLRSYAGKRRKKPQSGDPAGKRARAAAPPPPGTALGAAGASARPAARSCSGASPTPRACPGAPTPQTTAAAGSSRRLQPKSPPTSRRAPRPGLRPRAARGATAGAGAGAPVGERGGARVHRPHAARAPPRRPRIARFASELKDYQDGRGDKDAIVRRVHGLLAGYPDLIRDFYNFLPPGDRAAGAADQPPGAAPYRQQPAAPPPVYRQQPAAPPPAAALMPPVVQGRPPPRRRRRPPTTCGARARVRADGLLRRPRERRARHRLGRAVDGHARAGARPGHRAIARRPGRAMAPRARRAAALRGLRAAAGARPGPAPGSGRRQQAAQRAVAMVSVAGLRHGPPPPRRRRRRRGGGAAAARDALGPGGAVDAAVRTLATAAAMLRVFAAAAPRRQRPPARATPRAREDGRGGARRLPRDAATFALFADVAAKAAVALATNAAADDDLVAALAAFGAAAGAAATPLLARVIGLLPDATTVQSRVYVARMRKPTALAEVADAQDLLFADGGAEAAPWHVRLGASEPLYRTFPSAFLGLGRGVGGGGESPI